MPAGNYSDEECSSSDNYENADYVSDSDDEAIEGGNAEFMFEESSLDLEAEVPRKRRGIQVTDCKICWKDDNKSTFETPADYFDANETLRMKPSIPSHKILKLNEFL